MGDNYIRVKFYSLADWSSTGNLVSAEKVILSYDEKFVYSNINDIIELYNIQLYFEKQMYLKIWTDEMIDEYNSRVKDFSKSIGKYFSQIDENNFIKIYNTLDYEYICDFWILIEKYKIYNKLSTDFFNKNLLLDNNKIRIQDILKCKNIVKRYEQEIRVFFMENSGCAEILLSEFVVEKDLGEPKCYFPSIMSDDDKNQILLSYIESERANSNFLKTIYEGKSTKEFPINDKTKLKAKRRYDEEVKKIFETGVSFKYGVQLSFEKGTENISECKYNDDIMAVKYSLDWVEENLDYPTLLNNFIYLLEFTDLQFRIQHVNKPNKMGIFERLMGVKGKNEYKTGIAFNRIQELAMLQMISYNNLLSNMNIRLEEILKWFFESYLNNEFRVSGFYINLTTTDSTYLEKCRTIASEIDCILKQYKLFVNDRHIDSELLQLSSEHIFMKDIPSVGRQIEVDKYIKLFF